MNKFCLLGIFAAVCSLSAVDLAERFESEHFIIELSVEDKPIVQDLLEDLEAFYQVLSHDFNHSYSHQILIKLFPDNASFYEAIGKPNSPSWLIGQTGNHAMWRVSPQNPGPYHTFQTCFERFKVGLAELFMIDKYGEERMYWNDDAFNTIPRWVMQGVALYEADVSFIEPLEQVIQDAALLPGIELLENSGGDFSNFSTVYGFQASHAYIKYIVEQCGWPKILSLLENYSDFELIFEMSKHDFIQALAATFSSD